MKSVRSRCFFAYDPDTGEVFTGLVVVKPQDVIRMSDGGDIPPSILESIPHDVGIGWSGRTVVLNRVTHEIPADLSVSGDDDTISLHDHALLEGGSKEEILDRLDELDADHDQARRLRDPPRDDAEKVELVPAVRNVRREAFQRDDAQHGLDGEHPVMERHSNTRE